MFCKNCGNEVEKDAFCSICGAPLEDESVSEVMDYTPTTNPGKGMGIAALILGIIGVVIGGTCSCIFATCGGGLPLIGAVVGIVLGVIGLSQSKKAGYSNTPALIGLILSIVAIVVILIFICFNGIAGGIGGYTQAINSTYYTY